MRVQAARDIPYTDRTIAKGTSGTVCGQHELPNTGEVWYDVHWDNDTKPSRLASADDLGL